MSGIFRAYDIRGIYGKDIDADIARRIGAGFGTMKRGKIAVACDARLSGPALKKAFIEGLVSAGIQAVDCGMMATPMMVYTVARHGFDAGAIITASHNPPDYNGVKLFDKGGIPISWEAGIEQLENLVNGGEFRKGNGSTGTADYTQDYIGFVIGSISKVPKLKIAVDAMNGAYGKVGPEVLRRLGLDVVEVRCACNGDFPAAGPDPSHVENLKPLQEAVLREKADLGVAFDGDGDRLGVVDRTGRPLESKAVFGMLVRNAAADHPNPKVVYDILTSDTVVDAIKACSGVPIACRVGHTYITQKLLEDRASLAGELSGHYYFSETAGGDDALFAAAKLAEYLARAGRPLEKLSAEFPNYPQGSRRETIKADEKEKFIEGLKERLGKKYKIDTMDGVKIHYADGWAVFRYSNTEPKIVMAWEARSAEGFRKISELVEGIIREIPK
jgi:phosphomannomutase/phosphoglucomutase